MSSSSRRWRRARIHQLQRQATGHCRQRVRWPFTVTHGGDAAPPPTASAGGGPRAPVAELAVVMERRSTVLASSYRPDRPTRLPARPVLDIRPTRAGVEQGCRQGAETAGMACLQHSSAVRRCAGSLIAWPWLSRGRGGGFREALVAAARLWSVRPSRPRVRVHAWWEEARPMWRTALLPTC